MPETTPLQPLAPWVSLASTDADWDALDPGFLDTMLAQLHLIRTFEEEVLGLAGQKLINGPAHSSIGQEGGAVGSVLPLVAADQVNGSHRGHHQFLAKAINYVAPNGLDPRQPLPDEVREVLHRSMAEIAGLADGYCHGRGGSMHLQWKDAGAMGTNAIVGGGVPFAAGFAWADKRAGTDDVSVTYFGDGAVEHRLGAGDHEPRRGVEAAGLLLHREQPVRRLDHRGGGHRRAAAVGSRPGFGIPSWQVDGMDTVAVYLAMQQAFEHMRGGGARPSIEADTYRYFHQNGPFPGSAFGYRTKEEEQGWRDRDPIAKVEGHLSAAACTPRTSSPRVRKSLKAAMAEIGAGLVEPDPDGKPGQQRIRPELWPDPAFLDVGIRGDLSEPRGADRREESDFDRTSSSERKFIDVVAGRDGHRMETDPSVVVMGEDVHRLNGGTSGATKGLKDRSRTACSARRSRENGVHRPRRRPRARRPVPPGRRAHVRRLHVGRRRPALQPDRQGPAHVRRRPRHAAAAAHQGRHRDRLRVPALDGPRRHPRHLGRLADRRAVDPAGLRRPDERGPGAARTRSPCSSTTRPLQGDRPGAEARLRLLLPPGRPPSAGPAPTSPS